MQFEKIFETNEQDSSTDKLDALHFAFSKRQGSHSRALDFLLPENERAAAWEKRMDLKGEALERTAYLHIPYCRLRCLYCGFFKNFHERSRTQKYVQALLEDIKRTSQKAYCQEQPLQAVYFGGGTPGVMSAGEIKEVLAAVKANLPLAQDCEITFETSLSDLDDDQLEACLDGGVNRFSLGVQTFDTKIRQSLGRVDNEKRLRDRLEELTGKQKQAAIVIDLIYGLPGQTSELWQYDLDIAVESGIHGFDTYSLNVLPKSKLGELISTGKMPAVAPRHEQADYFAQAVQFLEQKGMRRLSICHWGRFDFKEKNIYNKLGKGFAGRIPFGSGAGGTLDGWRVKLTGDSEQYMEQIAAGIVPVEILARPDENYKIIADLKYGMDQGLVLTDRLPAGQSTMLEPLLTDWQQRGLLNRAREINELTLAGQFWFVELTQELVDYMQAKLAEG